MVAQGWSLAITYSPVEICSGFEAYVTGIFCTPLFCWWHFRCGYPSDIGAKSWRLYAIFLLIFHLLHANVQEQEYGISLFLVLSRKQDLGLLQGPINPRRV